MNLQTTKSPHARAFCLRDADDFYFFAGLAAISSSRVATVSLDRLFFQT